MVRSQHGLRGRLEPFGAEVRAFDRRADRVGMARFEGKLNQLGRIQVIGDLAQSLHLQRLCLSPSLLPGGRASGHRARPRKRAHANEIKMRFAGRDVTTGQIILFGPTGGLIPCPASITVLLLCLQLKQIALGATLVLYFSVGLAATMVTVGVAPPSACVTPKSASRAGLCRRVGSQSRTSTRDHDAGGGRRVISAAEVEAPFGLPHEGL